MKKFIVCFVLFCFFNSLSQNGFSQNIGIGTNSPSQRLDVNGRMRLRHNGVTAGMWLNKTDNSDASFIGQVNDSSFGIWDAPSNLWRFAFNHSNAWMGIGTTTPRFPLTFGNSVGDKISLWGGSGSPLWNHYGLGIQASLLQIFTPTVGDDIAFGTGRSGSFNETVRIKGNGRVGIGTSTPTADLTVNGNVKITDGTQGNGKVLTSDANGNASWRTPAMTNNDRFWLLISGSRPNANSAISLSFSTYYNNSPSIVINTNTGTITFNKGGLYHFEGYLFVEDISNPLNPPPDYTQGSSNASFSKLDATISYTTGNTTTTYPVRIVPKTLFYKYKSTSIFNSGISQSSEGKNSFDIFMNTGTTLSLSAFFPSGTSAEGHFSGYLISE